MKIRTPLSRYCAAVLPVLAFCFAGAAAEPFETSTHDVGADIPMPEPNLERPARTVSGRYFAIDTHSQAQVPPAVKAPPMWTPGDVFRDCPDCPEMVVILAGSFRMGCVSGQECAGSEWPVHEVQIGSAFALGRHEVTFVQWDACAADGGCGNRRSNDWNRRHGSRPVNVSWDDAQAYVSWLSRETGASYRLPSEAEWEYAARAGTTTRYSWGNTVGINRANCDGCGEWEYDETVPVGSFAANGFGLYDMHGNVREWTEDCWNASYEGAPSDGSAWLSGDCRNRVLRGGSWGNGPKFSRAASRVRNSTYTGFTINGFRVARTLRAAAAAPVPPASASAPTGPPSTASSVTVTITASPVPSSSAHSTKWSSKPSRCPVARPDLEVGHGHMANVSPAASCIGSFHVQYFGLRLAM